MIYHKMIKYKQIEWGIEYDVFELTLDEYYTPVRETEKIKYCKIIRHNGDLVSNDIYYYKFGNPHNENGPAAIITMNGYVGIKIPVWIQKVYYLEGQRLKDEEWKVYNRNKLIEKMLNED